MSVDYRFRIIETSAICRPTNSAGCRPRTAVIATYCESVQPLSPTHDATHSAPQAVRHRDLELLRWPKAISDIWQMLLRPDNFLRVVVLLLWDAAVSASDKVKGRNAARRRGVSVDVHFSFEMLIYELHYCCSNRNKQTNI